MRMRFTLALSVLAAFSHMACRRAYFAQQDDVRVEAVKKEITISVPNESDILFVLDNSGSMGEEIDNMRCSITGFVQALSATGNKFRVAVTTTDNQDQTNGNCVAPPGLSASVDPLRHGRCGRFLAPKGKAAFLKREDFATPEAMAAEFASYLQRDNATITTTGSAVEQPLKSAIAATDPALATAGAANEGFFRPDALLLVIIVSDESDCSFDADKAPTFASSSTPQPFGFDCYAQAADLVSPETWAARLLERKGGNRDLVRVGLISSSAKDASGFLKPASCRVTEIGGQSVATDDCACFYLNPAQGARSYCAFTKLSTPSTLTSGTCGSMGPVSTPSNVCPATPPANPGEGNCCIALANDRLFAFTNQFENEKDTICQKDFSSTLLRLADLADRQCFSLEKEPLGGDPANVELKIKRKDESTFTVIPLTTEAERGDGWYYTVSGDQPTACLSGTFKRKTGDTLSLFVVSSFSTDAPTDTPAE